MRSVAKTISGEIRLTSTCRPTMRGSLAPITRAAITNSRSRKESTIERVSRAKPGISLMPMAMIRFLTPGPSAATMAIASRMPGKASRTSTKRMITLSRRG